MTAPRRQHSWQAALTRALPRLAVVAVGLALILVSDNDVVDVIGVLTLVAGLLDLLRSWRYIRTGERPQPRVAAELSEPGPFAVELQAVGERQIDVIKVVREVTGAGLLEAKAATDSVPTTLVDGLSETSAERVRARLHRAGATTAVRGDGG